MNRKAYVIENKIKNMDFLIINQPGEESYAKEKQKTKN